MTDRGQRERPRSRSKSPVAVRKDARINPPEKIVPSLVVDREKVLSLISRIHNLL